VYVNTWVILFINRLSICIERDKLVADTIKHKQGRARKQTLYEMGYKYLCDNFHKFKEGQRIRIALEMIKVHNSKPLIDQSQHTHFKVRWMDDSDSIQAPQEPDENTSRFSQV